MKSDRLLSLLLLLQGSGRTSARELAERLEVTQRTIHRDVEALSSAGVPVYAERGRNGGIALLPGYRTDVSGLTAMEARALFVFAGRGSPAADLGFENDLRGALLKLMAALPPPQRPGVDDAQQRVLVDPRGWMRAAEDLPHLPAIQEAVWAGTRVRLRYKASGAASASERVLDPYGLVSKAGVWYLIAADRDEPRIYRVSRVEGVAATPEPARRPAGLDLEKLWTSLRRRVEDRGPGVEVVLRVRSERADMLLRMAVPQLSAPAERAPEAGPDGWLTLSLRFVGEGAAQGLLLGFGADVEVLLPHSLRRSFAAAARSILDLYITAERP